ncbi:MAG: type II toxin-antitoxin system RelE family toxin [Chloroflexaceae bacterium]
MAFIVIIKPDAEDDIQYYRVNEQRIIIDGIKTHLTAEPDTATKRKKKLRPNPIAPWELRVDIYRVFYAIHGTTVYVVAIGHKVHNRLYIRGKEVDL